MLTLAGNGKTNYRIVISAHASPSVFHAAEELKRFLGEITGANFPVAFDAPFGHLGDNNLALTLGRKMRLEVSNSKKSRIFAP